MNQISIVILLLIIILLFLVNMSSDKEDKIYFFLNNNDDKSLELLNNILKNSKSKVILVNYGKDIDLIKINKLINNCNKIRPIHKIMNIEKMEDLQKIYYNKKCINQPEHKFYELKNKVGVFGFPFDYEDNESELLNNQIDNNNTATIKIDDNILKNYVDVPTCGRRRSGCN